MCLYVYFCHLSDGISNRTNVITTKCSVSNCGMRFETQAAILLHEQCHSLNNNEIRCPKCEIDTTSTSVPVGATVTATGPPVPTMATNVSSSVNDGESMMMVTASTKTTSSRNWNWNTLHTHLWREHNIDMELYSCPHCPFKTPILSRLKNTHLKIHSDLRGIPGFYSI